MQAAALVGLWGLTLAAFFVFAAPVLLAAPYGTASPAATPGGLRSVRFRDVADAGFGALRLAYAARPQSVVDVRIFA